jgi:hypothetical protein
MDVQGDIRDESLFEVDEAMMLFQLVLDLLQFQEGFHGS